MSVDRPITVLLVDDHEVVRRGVRAFFASQDDLKVVAEAATGPDALAAAAEHHPDVALMDLRLPGQDGVETTRALRACSPGTHVIVLTSYGSDEMLYPALRAGALGYLLKDVAAEDLASAVRRAARGEPTLSPSIAARLMRDVASPEAHGPEPELEPLTPREAEVLTLVADGLSNHEIAARLHLAEATVKGHVSSLLAKLALPDRTKAAVYAWRSGLMSRDDE